MYKLTHIDTYIKYVWNNIVIYYMFTIGSEKSIELVGLGPEKVFTIHSREVFTVQRVALMLS